MYVLSGLEGVEANWQERFSQRKLGVGHTLLSTAGYGSGRSTEQFMWFLARSFLLGSSCQCFLKKKIRQGLKIVQLVKAVAAKPNDLNPEPHMVEEKNWLPKLASDLQTYHYDTCESTHELQ